MTTKTQSHKLSPKKHKNNTIINRMVQGTRTKTSQDETYNYCFSQHYFAKVPNDLCFYTENSWKRSIAWTFEVESGQGKNQAIKLKFQTSVCLRSINSLQNVCAKMLRSNKFHIIDFRTFKRHHKYLYMYIILTEKLHFDELRILVLSTQLKLLKNRSNNIRLNNLILCVSSLRSAWWKVMKID